MSKDKHAYIEARGHLADLVGGAEPASEKVSNIRFHVNTLIAYLRQEGVDVSSFETLLSDSSNLTPDRTISVSKELLAIFDDTYSKTLEYGQHLAERVDSIVMDVRKSTKEKTVELIKIFFELGDLDFESLEDLKKKLKKLKKKFARNFHPDLVGEESGKNARGEIMSRLNNAFNFVFNNLNLLSEVDVSSLSLTNTREKRETLSRIVLTRLSVGDKFQVTTASGSKYVIQITGFEQGFGLPVGTVVSGKKLKNASGVVFSSGNNFKVLELGDKVCIGSQNTRTSPVREIKMVNERVMSEEEAWQAVSQASSFRELISVVSTLPIEKKKRNPTIFHWYELMAKVGVPEKVAKFSFVTRKFGLRQKVEQLYTQELDNAKGGFVGNNLEDVISSGGFKNAEELLKFFEFLVDAQEITRITYLVNANLGQKKVYNVTTLINQLKSFINHKLTKKEQLSRVIRPIFDYK